MKIGVTAASGQLGAASIRALEKEIEQHQIVGFARTLEKAEHLDVEIRPGDYRQEQHWVHGLEDIDTLLFISSNEDPEERITMHRNVIKGAIEAEVQKIVYTSMVGHEAGNDFAPIVRSNRQTETDIQNTNIDWVICRNGIYIEPDLEYIEEYEKTGSVYNCAADGLCGYTSRKELAYAYTHVLLESKHNGKVYNLFGECITQDELVEAMNEIFETDLEYVYMPLDEFRADRISEIGEFYGTLVAGIYEGIRQGAFELPSHYEEAAGRPHKSVVEMMEAFKRGE